MLGDKTDTTNNIITRTTYITASELIRASYTELHPKFPSSQLMEPEAIGRTCIAFHLVTQVDVYPLVEVHKAD